VLTEERLEHVDEPLTQLVPASACPVVVDPLEEVSPVEPDGLLEARDLVTLQGGSRIARQKIGTALETLDIDPDLAEQSDVRPLRLEARIRGGPLRSAALCLGLGAGPGASVLCTQRTPESPQTVSECLLCRSIRPVAPQLACEDVPPMAATRMESQESEQITGRLRRERRPRPLRPIHFEAPQETNAQQG
jgi:hypothetical protein